LGGAFAVGERLEPYAAAGWNYFKGEFQTDARYSGFHDLNLLTTSGPTFPLSAGVGYRISERIRIEASAFYTPLQVRRQGVRVEDGLFNLRFAVHYRLR
jgi:outer membrane protein W